jgi:hypothetical protein
VTLKNIIGIDHAVVVVKDLDAAAANWKSLGFTASPRGTHSAKMGTGNYTMMLGSDYLELLGVLSETEHNVPTRGFLTRRGEGIERIAFTTTDATVGADEIRALGYTPIGPTDFERPVTMPDGTLSAAKFATYQWPYAEAPGGLRIFACQHKTRETVWIPELQVHANTAKRIKQVLVVTPEPDKDAAHMAKLIDGASKTEADGAVTVPSGANRADFVFVTKDVLAKHFPGTSLAGIPDRGGIALVFGASDLAAAEKAVGAKGAKTAVGVVVPPAEGNGVLLAFVQD